MDSAHAELEAEQEYVTRAYSLLDKGLADAEVAIQNHGGLDRLTARAMKRAREILQQSRGTGQLVAGRIDTSDSSLYVGRRRVYDENRDLVLIGWHAPAAIPFYEATADDPGDLLLKRVFQEENGTVHRIVDEIVRSSAHAIATGGSGSISDALLQELERSRDGAMREVVATIQAEQFRIIRADRERLVVVQGGPGTGKTVVGLHRAAWLAFNYEELRNEGILVVAPSRAFLSYAAGVLPSLEVTDIDQVEIGSLYPGEARERAIEPVEAARVKGSAAMSEVLGRALERRIGRIEDDLVLTLGIDRIVVPADTLSAIVADVRSRSLPHNEAREVLRNQLAARAYELHEASQRDARRPVRTTAAMIRRLSAFTNALDRLWPTYTPEEFLRTLYGTQTWLVDAAAGVLTVDERAQLYRRPAESIAAEPWTRADIHVLDEVSHLLDGTIARYGHVVVDEAQDLSPMAARALARRCPSGSMTVLGDLAQATGPWVRDRWEELTEHLTADDAFVADLTVGYRVPSEVINLAGRQLDLISPDLTVPASVRTTGVQPTVELVERDALETALELGTNLAEAGRKTAVIVADHAYEAAAGLSAGVAGDGRDGDFSAPLTLLPVSGCKGLEFDVVVLVEPGEIVGESTQGHRLLYVAMTRCTQQLYVVHRDRLPAGLAHLDGGAPSSEGGSVTTTRESDELDGIERASRVADLIAELSEEDLILVEALVQRLTTTRDLPDGESR
ncbi:DNA helicase IV [Mumia flava]|uniref:DNA helicase IV n=1 Tax=Mumia flava TaxID=1348852 RepID=A0A2M9B718_9ACTN|nr:ATP-binding domain-containing protein [Mumia flava]PJJ53751.1 DNA helicase IV [Mumia flava]